MPLLCVRACRTLCGCTQAPWGWGVHFDWWFFQAHSQKAAEIASQLASSHKLNNQVWPIRLLSTFIAVQHAMFRAKLASARKGCRNSSCSLSASFMRWVLELVLFFQFMMIYAASNTGFRQERYFLMQSMQRLIQGISVSDTSKRYVAQPSRDLFLTLEEDFWPIRGFIFFGIFPYHYHICMIFAANSLTDTTSTRLFTLPSCRGSPPPPLKTWLFV